MAKAKLETELTVAAMNSVSVRAKVMIFNVFPSEIGEHYSLRPETVSCSMKLNSYTSKVSTDDLKTEMSLRKVLISANTALGLHLTGRLKIRLTADATGKPFFIKCLETDVTALSIQCHHLPLPKTQANSGESDKGLKFQLYPVSGTRFLTHSVLS